MTKPIVINVIRGETIESRHLVSYAVIGPDGALLSSSGDADAAIFPRSSIKAFQALPLIESGAADAFGFTDEELALAVSSHSGQPHHVETVAGMLAKIGLDETALECGANWPLYRPTHDAMIRDGTSPRPIHNECSGKHAGMLALARHMNWPHGGYVEAGHPVQQSVRTAIGEICGADIAHAPCGIDGCSVPTWALPLEAVARGFGRFASGHGLSPQRREACARIQAAVRAHPDMVAGTERFDTNVMTAVPRLFIKSGAEGYMVAAIPHAGIGIAAKCLDGASRASTTAMIALLLDLDVWTTDEQDALAAFAARPLFNRRNDEVGLIEPAN